MVRYRGQKALYEVIKQSSLKSSALKPQQTAQPEPVAQNQTQSGEQEQILTEQMTKWPRYPKMIQLNAERVEISMPYHLAIVAVLVIILFIMLAYRFGQKSGLTAVENVSKVDKSVETGEPVAVTPIDAAGRNVERSVQETVSQPVVQTGKENRIVIATHKDGRELEPVKNYFNENGIAAEIRKIERVYYLVTKDKCGDPLIKDSDGYVLLQKVKKIGLGYKTPQGYASFGPRPFQDAYGKKFDD